VVVTTAATVLAVAAPSSARAAAQHAEADCFWLGPISTKQRSAGSERYDGRYFNFPETSATYWLARYRLASGDRLVLHGRYAHARYESLNSYAQGGTPTFSLPDILIRPRSGATNPFRAGARRDRRSRGWTVGVVDASPPASPAANTMYAPSTATASSELVLRVYEPDRGRDLTGGVGLPNPMLVKADGTAVRSRADVCTAVNDPERSIARIEQRLDPTTWQSLVNTDGPTPDPATSPAFDPPQWERFFNQAFGAGVFTQAAGNPRPLDGMHDTGGFYSNRDSRYILTHLSRRFGRAVVITGRMPAFPHTADGIKRMATAAQLRYWSLCSGGSPTTLFTPACVADQQVPLDRHREYTIVVTDREDRPSNARRKCGIAWLNWGTQSDGAGRRDYGLLLMRNVLASPSFANAVQHIKRYGDERQVMGPYFPRSKYMSIRAVERLGCR